MTHLHAERTRLPDSHIYSLDTFFCLLHSLHFFENRTQQPNRQPYRVTQSDLCSQCTAKQFQHVSCLEQSCSIALNMGARQHRDESSCFLGENRETMIEREVIELEQKEKHRAIDEERGKKETSKQKDNKISNKSSDVILWGLDWSRTERCEPFDGDSLVVSSSSSWGIIECVKRIDIWINTFDESAETCRDQRMMDSSCRLINIHSFCWAYDGMHKMLLSAI